MAGRRGIIFAAVCVLLCLQISLSQAAKEVTATAPRFSDVEYESGFMEWMRVNLRTYSAADWSSKYEKFKKNMDFIDEFNKRNESFKVGLNIFADMSVDEFRSLLLRPATRARNVEDEAEIFTGEGIKIPRANLDWRASGAVTAVKNQGSCGSCWTFAAAGSIESAYKIAGGNLTALSEQNLLDCEVLTSKGCNGGSYTAAFTYVKNNGGISTMAAYPYEGVQKTCRYSAANAGATIGGFTWVAANDEGALLAAVTQTPTVVGIQGDLQSFQFYKSGTYANTSCTAANLNHAVIAVGYGTDANGDYWLLKNSWGTGWGQSGYCYMKRGANTCGIAAQAAFPTKAAKPTTGSATTGSATTGSATTGSATTGSSTTGGSRSGQVFIDALASGWQVGYVGNMTGLTVTASGQNGYAVSATITSGSGIIFASNPSLSTSSFTSLKFAVKTSVTTNIGYGFGLVVPSQSTTASSTWKSIVAPLSTLGSPSSVQYIVFDNKSGSSVVLSLDNVQFA